MVRLIRVLLILMCCLNILACGGQDNDAVDKDETNSAPVRNGNLGTISETPPTTTTPSPTPPSTSEPSPTPTLAPISPTTPVPTPSPSPSPSVKISVVISWDIPTTRTDGSELLMSEIDGYRMMYRNTLAPTYTTLLIDGGSTNSYRLTELDPGEYEVMLAVIDTYGEESDFSAPFVGIIGPERNNSAQ